KMGGELGLSLSGIDITQYSFTRSVVYSSNGLPGDPQKGSARMYQWFSPPDVDTVEIGNTGNVDLPLVVFDIIDRSHTALLDTTLIAGESIELAGFAPSPVDSVWQDTAWYVIDRDVFLGFAVGPVEYIIGTIAPGLIILDGSDYFCLGIKE
ncbi:MAG: hypothetical protein JSW54_07860, partial [Fidelibacterota bacterium]